MRFATVYVMEAGDRRKVGSSVNPLARKNYEPRGEIVMKAVAERRTIVYCSPFIENARKVEAHAHQVLKGAGMHIRGEWFSASVDKCIEAIECALAKAGKPKRGKS